MKNKTKTCGIIVFIAIIAFLSSNCASTNEKIMSNTSSLVKEGKNHMGKEVSEIFDESVPLDQSAILTIPGGYYNVFEFSGKSVNWYKITVFGETVVQIPSGTHTLKFNYFPGGDKRVIGSNVITFRTAYKAGHSYELQEKIGLFKTSFRLRDWTTMTYIDNDIR